MKTGLPVALPIIALLMVAGWAFAEFRTPPPKDRQAALGALHNLPAPLQKAFQVEDDFVPKKEPQPADWLAQHQETGQTFPQYLASKPNRPGDGGRRTLYVLPLGDFPEVSAPSLKKLQENMALYYAPMTVKFLPAIPEEKVPANSRVNNFTKQTQWQTRPLLRWLQTQVPRDGYGLLAVTMTDLYPDEEWNFVFGQASYKKRVGVFSFARFRPAQGGEEADRLVLRRACKVLTHEMGHMFGIKHCIYYECNMSGANSLREADSTPMHLCPVCLRKLQHAVGFDPLSRYQSLQKFYQKEELSEESKWLAQRIKFLQEE